MCSISRCVGLVDRGLGLLICYSYSTWRLCGWLDVCTHKKERVLDPNSPKTSFSQRWTRGLTSLTAYAKYYLTFFNLITYTIAQPVFVRVYFLFNPCPTHTFLVTPMGMCKCHYAVKMDFFSLFVCLFFIKGNFSPSSAEEINPVWSHCALAPYLPLTLISPHVLFQPRGP